MRPLRNCPSQSALSAMLLSSLTAAPALAATEPATASPGGASIFIAVLLVVALVLMALRLVGAERRLRILESERGGREDGRSTGSRAVHATEEDEGSTPAPDGPEVGTETESAARLDALLEAALEAVIVTDREGRIQALSAAARRLVGGSLEAHRGRPLIEVLPLRSEAEAEASFDPVSELRSAGEPTRFGDLYLYEQEGGRTVHLEVSGAAVGEAADGTGGFVLALRDVTDRQMFEVELAKAQKLESLGLLASGIAHDFNNLLTIMMGNFSLLQADSSLPEELRTPIAEAEKALARARGLADQLLTFSTGGGARTRSTDLGELIRDSASFVFRGAKSRCVLDLPGNLPPVDVDPEQISQVFNNLLINARQAMADRGTVRVKAEAIKIGLGKTKLRPGSYVRVTLEDDGEGIAAETLGQIFDPYFTTKQSGSGLGLATSYSIIKRHRGSIEVESEPGKGTTFMLWLRTAKRPVERKPEESQAESEIRGRVLVLDDEHSILALLSAALKRLGFEAVTATDGRVAIEACEAALEAGQPFQLAILDLLIPGGMGGVETAAELARIQPSLLLVASSGYARNPALVDYADYGFHQVLVKPYRISDLASLLDELLQGSKGPGTGQPLLPGGPDSGVGAR
ncbi:MAG: ATP-binding protein [Holophagales bacterium]|nr:ATP-binding protein [Holophagales bacterium]